MQQNLYADFKCTEKYCTRWREKITTVFFLWLMKNCAKLSTHLLAATSEQVLKWINIPFSWCVLRFFLQQVMLLVTHTQHNTTHTMPCSMKFATWIELSWVGLNWIKQVLFVTEIHVYFFLLFFRWALLTIKHVENWDRKAVAVTIKPAQRRV